MKTKIIKKNDPYWICEMCQICKICYTGFTNNNKPNLVCEICYLSYHYLCGRLSITLIDYNKYRFVC